VSTPGKPEGSMNAIDGTETSVHLASSPDVGLTNGGYWRRSRPGRPSRAARNDESARRLWGLSEEPVTNAGIRLAI
jgi:hypothetical protein